MTKRKRCLFKTWPDHIVLSGTPVVVFFCFFFFLKLFQKSKKKGFYVCSTLLNPCRISQTFYSTSHLSEQSSLSYELNQEVVMYLINKFGARKQTDKFRQWSLTLQRLTQKTVTEDTPKAKPQQVNCHLHFLLSLWPWHGHCAACRFSSS